MGCHHQDDGCVIASQRIVNCMGCLQSVHARHFPVKDDDVIVTSRCMPRQRLLDGFAAGYCGLNMPSKADRRNVERGKGERIIVGNQYRQVGHFRRGKVSADRLFKV